MKRIIKICVLVTFFSPIAIYAGNEFVSVKDSLVPFGKLKYCSRFDKEVIEDYISGERDYLAMFMAGKPGISEDDYDEANEKINRIVEELNTPAFMSKGMKKKIALTKQVLVRELLKKYQEINHFTSIFSTGEYNCVSATALYGIIFKRLNIECRVKELPGHVVLIATEKGVDYVVEATDSGQGYYDYNSGFKEDYLQNLAASGIISEKEANGNTFDKLFEQYFYNSSLVELSHLAGFQFCNAALYCLDLKKQEEALIELEKAYVFYPVARIRYLYTSTLYSILKNSDFKNLSHADYLVRLSNLSEERYDNNFILYCFQEITTEYLVKAKKTEPYDSIYVELCKGVTNKKLLKDLQFYYNREMGRVTYNKGKYKSSLPFAKAAYELNPDNADAVSLLIISLVNSFGGFSDPIGDLDSINQSIIDYPEIKDDLNFLSGLANLYMFCTNKYLDKGKLDSAKVYLAKFEELYKNEKDLSIHEINIANVFNQFAFYYYKKQRYADARNMLNRGLVYVPDNEELKRQLRELPK